MLATEYRLKATDTLVRTQDEKCFDQLWKLLREARAFQKCNTDELQKEATLAYDNVRMVADGATTENTACI